MNEISIIRHHAEQGSGFAWHRRHGDTLCRICVTRRRQGRANRETCIQLHLFQPGTGVYYESSVCFLFPYSAVNNQTKRDDALEQLINAFRQTTSADWRAKHQRERICARPHDWVGSDDGSAYPFGFVDITETEQGNFCLAIYNWQSDKQDDNAQSVMVVLHKQHTPACVRRALRLLMKTFAQNKAP